MTIRALAVVIRREHRARFDIVGKGMGFNRAIVLRFVLTDSDVQSDQSATGRQAAAEDADEEGASGAAKQRARRECARA